MTAKKWELMICVVTAITWFMRAGPLFAHSLHEQDQPYVALEINYHMPEAGQVCLVWGINGWSVIPDRMRPPNTTVRDSLMYTPMEHVRDRFIAKLQAPRGAVVNYVFQITKKADGSLISVWDTNNGRDYQAVATREGKFETGKQTLDEARGSPGGPSSGMRLLAGSCIILLICLMMNLAFRRKFGQAPDNPAMKVFCAGISLCFFLLLIRAQVTGAGWNLFSSTIFIPEMFLSGYYDFVYAGTLTGVFLAIVPAVRRRKNIYRLLYPAYAIIGLLSLLVALLNIKIVAILGKPFTYQWLYYSDFLRSLDAKNAVFSNFSWTLAGSALSLCGAMAIFAMTLTRGMHLLLGKIKAPFFWGIFFIGLLLVYLPLAKWYVKSRSHDYFKLENPVVSFFSSFMASQKSPRLFTMETTVGPEDFRPVSVDAENRSFAYHYRDKKIQNVIFFVLESVPLEYIDIIGRKFSVTPVLTRHLHQAASFKDIYAHAPSTNKSLVSLLCSVYPWISYVSMTQADPSISLPSLSSELKKHGYRTAFLSAADNRFQNLGAFLSYRQFDVVKDYRNLNCYHRSFVVKQDRWDFSDGTDDDCVVDAFAEWAGEDNKQPFFAILWTYQTHYPYFTSGTRNNFGAKSDAMNRYLNALHHSDYVLGRLLQWLEERNLSESTLVVVVGDHGEAFGRHNQGGHASKIYEENLHVPLFLINKKLFRGEEYSTLGGVIDIAPTVMDILGLPRSPQWQGRSLFSSNRTNRVYFFAPWSNYLFGYRQNNLKFIFNASDDTYEVYDLNKDPEETENLAGYFPGFVNEGKLRLAAWVQFQNKFQQSLMKVQDKNPGQE